MNFYLGLPISGSCGGQKLRRRGRQHGLVDTPLKSRYPGKGTTCEQRYVGSMAKIKVFPNRCVVSYAVLMFPATQDWL
jgi:hypothetical protein